MTAFDSFQPLMAIATTPEAATILQPLSEAAQIRIWSPENWDPGLNLDIYNGSLKEHLVQHWPRCRAVVFCMAMGATVRLIAPLLSNKDDDPAVVVVDHQGQFVVSVCGGHRQATDQLTRSLATLLQSTAVITGASAGKNWPGVDTLGIPFGWQRQASDWTAVSSCVAKGESVSVHQESGTSLWQAMLPADHPLNPEAKSQQHAATVWIGHHNPPQFSHPAIAWTPRVLWIGLGCERNTSPELIETAVRSVLATQNLSTSAVAGVASLELKQDEAGILALCDRFGWPFLTFDAQTLSAIEVPTPSSVVQQAVQTPSVSEAAALVAAQQYGSWNQTSASESGAPEPGTSESYSLKLKSPKLISAKTIHRDEQFSGAVTVAIALAEREWIGHAGQLALIGCGPGQLSHMTPAAQAALSHMDVVIGYQLYIDLVRSCLRPGQIIEASPITQERSRAQRAIELAQWGLKVAVISSGDAGIYGMAGLVMELLESKHWDGQCPAVEIFPGISALQAAASRVGTPLMHDFCAISLSDLLTPWDVIESRLEAAAAADFVTALYNPKSQNRQTQLARAQSIFLKHRAPQTPIAIVRSAYRGDEFRQCSTLDQLHTLDVDMLTLVLIGNRSTRLYQDWIITPRGYLGLE